MKHRRGLLWFLLPLLMILGTFTFAFASLTPKGDQVEIKETTVYGDPAAAAGLAADYRINYQRHLFWDVALRPSAGGPSLNTEMSYHQLAEEEDQQADAGLSLQLPFYGNTYFSSQKSVPPALADAFAALSEETALGEKKSKTFPLNQFYEYYPLTGYIFLPGEGSSQLQLSISETALQDFFSIPVLPRERVTLTVDKSHFADGRLSLRYIPAFDIEPTYVTTDEAVYFTFNENMTRVDTSQIPGGYGIYRLPYDGADSKYPDARVEELSNILPLDSATDICGLRLDSRQETLYLYTLEDEGEDAWLTLVDLKSLVVKQRLALSDEENKYVDTAPWYQDDRIIVTGSEKNLLLFAADEDGCYRKALTALLPTAEDPKNPLFYIRTDSVFAWDGQRLAFSAASPKDPYDRNWDQLGFSLAVYDQSGLLYCGDYKPLMNPDASPGKYEYLCNPGNPKYSFMPSLRWETAS